MKKIIIIDGNTIMHRAYHALPPLTDTKGTVVNAVYGFISMLLKMIAEQKPDYMAVCFDRSEPTIRQSLYVGYHAHRPQLASDFAPQFVIIDDVLKSMHVQIFSVAGYEADDCIGTIVKRVSAGRPKSRDVEQIESLIVTGDRDLLQLVDSNTKVLMLVTGLSKTVLFDEKFVQEKYGVYPSQFVDYKALIGDASDGYPGVNGIGPKTAAGLIQKFKTFENIYHNLGDVTDKQRTQLATDAEQASLAKKLATIICDVPMQFNVEDCSSKFFDVQGLYDSLTKLGFKTLRKRAVETFSRFIPESAINKSQLSLLE